MMNFCDGFGHYTQSFMGDMWDVVAPATSSDFTGTTITQGLTIGRFGEGGVTFATASGPQSTTFVIQQPNYIQQNYNGVSTIYVGLAVQQTATQLTEGGLLIAFLSGGSTQVGIYIMPSGQLRAYRSTTKGGGIYLVAQGRSPAIGNANYTVLGQSADAVSSNAYDFLEFKVTSDVSTGAIEVRRNGSAFWTLSGVNTDIEATGNTSSVLIGGYAARFGGNTTENHFLKATISDVYILNETVNGSDALDPVTFIGDRHWQARTPTTDGHYAQWTPSTGSNHAALVDEIPPNTTDYNSTSGVGNIDSFNTDDPSGPATASVICAYTMYLQKDTGGATGVEGLFRLAGSDRVGTEFQVPSPWAFKQSFLCSKPGGGAITVADFGAGEHGYKRSS